MREHCNMTIFLRQVCYKQICILQCVYINIKSLYLAAVENPVEIFRKFMSRKNIFMLYKTQRGNNITGGDKLRDYYTNTTIISFINTDVH